MSQPLIINILTKVVNCHPNRIADMRQRARGQACKQLLGRRLRKGQAGKAQPLCGWLVGAALASRQRSVQLGVICDGRCLLTEGMEAPIRTH